MDENGQFAALSVMDYVIDLFTAAGRETFSRDQILVVLNNVKNDQDIFDPDVVVAHQIAMADIE